MPLSLLSFVVLFSSHEVALGQKFAQKILIGPLDTNVIKGETIVLPCKVAQQSGQVQWTKNRFGLGSDRKLPGFPRYQMIGSSADGEYNLEISDVDISDDADFQCQIGKTEMADGQTSNNAKLTVLVPPKPPRFSGLITRLTGREGHTLEVSCVSEGGKPAPQLKWVVSKTPDGSSVIRELFTTEKHISVQQRDKTYTIHSNLRYTPIQNDNANFLVCYQIHSALSNKSFVSAELDIHYPPRVTVVLNSTNEALREGQSAQLHCMVDAKPSADLQYIWRLDGQMLVPHGQDLFIPQLRKDQHHDKTYSCQVTNDIGSGSGSYLMRLQYGPKPNETGKIVEVEAGATANLHCLFDGNPTPTYKWTKNGRNGETLHEGPSYTIANVQREKEGIYRCEATVAGFTPVYQNRTLIVRGPPRVSIQRKFEAAEGSTVDIPCTIAGPKPTSVVWYKGVGTAATQLSNSPHTDEKKSFLISDRLNPDGTFSSVLRIINIYGSDFDLYNCTATNEFGSEYGQILLISLDPIPLYVMIPGVIGGCVAILVLALALVIVNRKYLCRCGSKSSQSDDHSDVMVKVEALDGGVPLSSYYPDMYTPSNEQPDFLYGGKDYMPIPMAEQGDFDNLPPPYPMYPYNSASTFSAQSPLTTAGQVVHMAYMDDRDRPALLHQTSSPKSSPPHSNGNGQSPQQQPFSPEFPSTSAYQYPRQPYEQQQQLAPTTCSNNFDGRQQLQLPYGHYQVPRGVYSEDLNNWAPGQSYLPPNGGHYGLEPVQEVNTPELEYGSDADNSQKTTRVSSQNSTHV